MIEYKFDESNLLAEFENYVDKTYTEHYSTKSGELQTFELMLRTTDMRALYFATMSCLKYSDRFGLKDGFNRKDLFKIAHFAILAIHALDKYNEQDQIYNSQDLEFYDSENVLGDNEQCLSVDGYQKNIYIGPDIPKQVIIEHAKTFTEAIHVAASPEKMISMVLDGYYLEFYLESINSDQTLILNPYPASIPELDKINKLTQERKNETK